MPDDRRKALVEYDFCFEGRAKDASGMRAAAARSKAVGVADVARGCGSGYDPPAGKDLDVPVQLFVGIVFRIAE